MKKSILFLSALATVVTTFAQEIPNGGFKTFTGGIPDSWTAATASFTGKANGYMRFRTNPNTKTSNDDSTSVYVTAQNVGTVQPGVIVSGVGSGASVGLSGVSGGFPHTTRPAVLSGYFKYKTLGSNHGGVSIIVTHWNGTSRDTLGGYVGGLYSIDASIGFVYQNIPITYKPLLSSVTPDSIQIVLMSSQTAPPLANEVAAIGDSLYVDLLRFSSCTPDPNATLGNTPIITSNPPTIPADDHVYTLANSDPRVINYTFTAAIPARADVDFMGFAVVVNPLDSVHAHTPMGLPPGITFTPGHPSGSLYQNSIGCYTLTGTLPSTNDVKYDIVFNNTASGISSFFQLGFEDGSVATQGSRPVDTVTIIVGTPTTVPTQTYTPGPAIAPLEIKNTQKFDGGVKHSVFVCNDGTVKACGDNTYGQLGDGTTIRHSTPVAVSGLTDVVAVSAGQFHSLFLKSDGTVWTCGRNHYGQLGVGSTTTKITPVQITTLSGIVAISAGYNHSLFLKNDGTVWACGRNSSVLGGGQLGDGTTTQRNTPVQTTITNVAQVSGGAFFSLFLKKDGTAWGVGANYIGQIGDGTKTNRSTAVQVISLGDEVRAVAAGFDHSIFLKKDGTVYTCGINVCGELADGTTLEKIVPIKVQQLSEIVAVDAGSDQNIYLKNDGTVYGSGINGSGELGDGTDIERHGIVTTNITGVNSIAAGDYFSLFGKTDSTVWGTGVNTFYQLGDGTFINRHSPVEVSSLCSVHDGVVGLTGINEYSKTTIASTIYPNPNSGSFVIRAEGVEDAKLTITNLLGETVYVAMMYTERIAVDLSNQPNGMYQYTIQNEDGAVSTGKIIIIK